MPSDTAIQELLYAILKQKCLKDLKWEEVASDPIHSKPITNGHAARMRYSRFKKQMDRKNDNNTPTTNTPKRSRVEKNRSPAKMKRGSRSGVVKPEDGTGEASEREGTVDSTADMSMLDVGMDGIARVKQERGSRYTQNQTGEGSESGNGNGMLMTPLPSTPRYCIEDRSQSPSPSLIHNRAQVQEQDPGQSFATNGIDDYVGSFGIGSEGVGESLFGEVIGGHAAEVYGMGMHGGLGVGMGMENSFESLWDPNQSMHSQSQSHGPSQSHGGGGEGEGVSVKTEPRWEEAYRHT
ncbi:hypothetical protein EG329_006138 [Mollisiaceae sp. DMI_Dod_QoI]|nr:hypothetical protein EG329_006138 [Helotiales sp. DMI_Dod_QoI]